MRSNSANYHFGTQITIEPYLKCAAYFELSCNKDSVKFKNAFISGQWNNAYNSVIVFGDSGTGKSHFLFSFFDALLNIIERNKIGFWTGNNFIAEFINATMNKQEENFVDNCKKLDVLLIDAFESLEISPKMQECFLEILNYFAYNKKLILFSTSKTIQDLELIPKLKYELNSALILNIKKPTVEDLEKFISLKVSEIKPTKSIEFISMLKNEEISDFKNANYLISKFINTNKNN